MKNDIQIEICTGSLTDVINATKISEVDRIELNCALELGGLTPSLATFIKAKQSTDKKIICMVRPRPAGFIYNQFEKETMLYDAKIFLDNGADGIVFGSLTNDYKIDKDFTFQMTNLIHSYKKEAVFHKAFDVLKNMDEGIEDLISLHVDRILTSGGEENVEKGIDKIKRLNEIAQNRIEILPGGGVDENNAKKVLELTKCSQIHMTAKITINDCGNYYAVSNNKIKNIISTLSSQTIKQGHRMTQEDIEMFKNDSYESNFE